MAPAPPRTVLALLTHTAPHKYTSRLCKQVSLLAFVGMRCNFVSTVSLFLSITDVSSQHCYLCGILSSSSITRLLRYYDAIRIPLPHLPSFLDYRLSGILTSLQESKGPPGLPYIHNVKHAMVLDPGEANRFLLLTSRSMLTSEIVTASSLPASSFEAQSLQP